MMKGDQYKLSNKNKENQECWREVAIFKGDGPDRLPWKS